MNVYRLVDEPDVRRLAARVVPRLRERDRLEALERLAATRRLDAGVALLRRFTFTIEPSTADHEEKRIALGGVVACGEAIVPAIVETCRLGVGLGWLLRALRDVAPRGRLVEALLELLDAEDCDYAIDPEAKVFVLASLADAPSPCAIGAGLRLLGDLHEPVRYYAARLLLAVGDPSTFEALAATLTGEESTRLAHLVAAALAAARWPVPTPLRERLRVALPIPFSLDGEGRVVEC